MDAIVSEYLANHEKKEYTLTTTSNQINITFIGNLALVIKINGNVLSFDGTPRLVSPLQEHGYRDANDILDVLEMVHKIVNEPLKWCIICGDAIDYPDDVPSACGKQICQYKVEEFIGENDTTVLEAVKEKTEEFKFLLNISLFAIRSPACQDILEPFPLRFVKDKDKYIRGEIGALTGNVVKKDIDKLRRVASAIEDVNSFVDKVKGLDDEKMIREFFGEDLYYLVRFIVRSNCTSFHQVDILNMKLEQYRFQYPIEIEKKFEEKKEKHGSKFLFHGSRGENWHSILRNGLKVASGTKLQRNGSAHGSGIYLADNFQTSVGFTGGLQHKYGKIVGVCEVLGASRYYKNHGIYVVNNEDNILLRYILIPDSKTVFKDFATIDKKFKETTNIVPKPKKISGIGNRRLMSEFMDLQSQEIKDLGIRVETRDDNLYIWDIYLSKFDPDALICKDLKEKGIEEVRVEILFAHGGEKRVYPISPPFVRIVWPRFQFHTGHITIGGSFCIELLTNQGWSSVYRIENLLVQLKAMIVEGHGRLDPKQWNQEYSLQEAENAFVRVARQHRWF